MKASKEKKEGSQSKEQSMNRPANRKKNKETIQPDKNQTADIPTAYTHYDIFGDETPFILHS